MEVGSWRELVVVSAEQEFRKNATGEGRVCGFAIGDAGGEAEQSESANVRGGVVDATGPQRHDCTKAETGYDDGALEFGREPGKSSLHIARFGVAVVGALAESDAAKVEAEGGATKAPDGVVEHLHSVVDNFVVQVAAPGGVRMAYQGGKG
jgi:hypothetical protein